MALLCVETQLKDKMITKVVVEPQQNVVFIFASYEEVLIVKHSILMAQKSMQFQNE